MGEGLGRDPQGRSPDSTKVLTDLAIRSSTMVVRMRTTIAGSIVRPRAIAHLLCAHGRWLSAGRPPRDIQEPPIPNTTNLVLA